MRRAACWHKDAIADKLRSPTTARKDDDHLSCFAAKTTSAPSASCFPSPSSCSPPSLALRSAIAPVAPVHSFTAANPRRPGLTVTSSTSLQELPPAHLEPSRARYADAVAPALISNSHHVQQTETRRVESGKCCLELTLLVDAILTISLCSPSDRPRARPHRSPRPRPSSRTANLMATSHPLPPPPPCARMSRLQHRSATPSPSAWCDAVRHRRMAAM